MRDLDNNKAKVQKTNPNDAGSIIRKHMLDHYRSIDAMMDDAETVGKEYHDNTDFAKGKRLAEARGFVYYPEEASDFLKKIYNPEEVKKLGYDKAWDRYTGLIGREYARMAEAKRKGKL